MLSIWTGLVLKNLVLKRKFHSRPLSASGKSIRIHSLSTQLNLNFLFNQLIVIEFKVFIILYFLVCFYFIVRCFAFRVRLLTNACEAILRLNYLYISVRVVIFGFSSNLQPKQKSGISIINWINKKSRRTYEIK